MKKLTLERRKELATELGTMIQAGIDQRGSLQERWDVNEAFYRNQPPLIPSKVWKDAAQYHIPLVQPKVDTLVAATTGTIIGSEPYVIARERGDEQARMEEQENDIHYLMEGGAFDSCIVRAATIAACCGVCPVRVSFDVEAQGFGSVHEDQSITLDVDLETPKGNVKVRYAGVVFDVIHPADFIMYPAAARRIPAAKLVGYRFYRRVAEVRELQKAGRYFEDVEIFGGDMPEVYAAGRDEAYARSSPSTSIASSEDQLVELWSCILRMDCDGDGVEELYDVVYAEGMTELLLFEPYKMSRPWFFDFRFHEEYGSFWPAGSIAQNLQGLQLMYSELHNLLLDGSYMTAFPPIFMDGSAMMGQQQRRYEPGEVIPTEGGVQPYSPNTRFDPGAMPMMIQQIERLADTVVRISANGQGTQFRSGITATEVAQVAAGQQQGIDQYIQRLGVAVVQVTQFIAELYRLNFDLLKSLHGTALQLEEPPSDTARYELNGKSPVNTAASRIANAQMLMQFADDPQVGADKYELFKALLENSQLPNGEKCQIPKELMQMGLQQMLGEMNGQIGPDGAVVGEAGSGDLQGLLANSVGSDAGNGGSVGPPYPGF